MDVTVPPIDVRAPLAYHGRASEPPPRNLASAEAAPRALVPGRFRAPSEEELRALLAQHRGNLAAVGREFGKERMQVHRWLRKYGIDVEAYR